MSKVSLAEQIEAVETFVLGTMRPRSTYEMNALNAALGTLKLIAKYEPEVRDLLSLCIKRDDVLPGSAIEVRE